MKEASDVRVGNLILIDGAIFKVEAVDVKGAAKTHKTINLKMRDITSGKYMEHTYLQEDKLEEAEVRHNAATYSYQNADMYCFIDTETFENYEVPEDLIGDKTVFLKENDRYTIEIYEGRPIGVIFPERMKFKVTTSPPGIKQHESTTPKQITLENGLVVDAPQFIEEGDIVEIDTNTGKYIDRVQE